MPARHQFSLCDIDFYPLIHVRTKWMTYDEKVIYRANHAIPSTIDEWIAQGKTQTKAPTASLLQRGLRLEYLLWQDDVECILNVIRKEVGIQ